MYLDYKNMDNVLSVTTGIEVLVTLLLFYIFPLFSFLLYGSVIGVHVYFQKQKIKSNLEVTTMKSSFYTQSDKFAFRDVPLPEYGPNEVMIQVKGASINPADYKLNFSKIPFIRWLLPVTVGRDVSGIVVEMGINVTGFNKGDQVYGLAYGGSLQEYTIVKPHQIAIKPSNIGFPEAASVVITGLTSYQSLNYFSKLESGKNMLIIGASGGCGSVAVQIAKSYGATVYGVCSINNVDFVKSLGADFVLDYKKENFLDDIKDIKFDLIYDTVTSPEDPDQEPIFTPYLSGNYVAINSTQTSIDIFRGVIKKEKRSNYHCHLCIINSTDLNSLKELIESGQVKPARCEVVPLSEASVNESFDKLKTRRTVGKLAFVIE